MSSPRNRYENISLKFSGFFCCVKRLSLYLSSDLLAPFSTLDFLASFYISDLLALSLFLGFKNGAIVCLPVFELIIAPEGQNTVP